MIIKAGEYKTYTMSMEELLVFLTTDHHTTVVDHYVGFECNGDGTFTLKTRDTQEYEA